MNLIAILSDVRDKIVSSSLAGIEARLDCICDALDGLAGPGDGGGNMPYPPPEPGPIEPPPPISGDDEPVEAGRPSVCQAAYGLASHVQAVYVGLAELISTREINPETVGETVRTVSPNTFVQLVQSILFAIWAELLRVISVFGYAIAAIMLSVADEIEPDIFVCAFLDNWDGTEADPVAITADCQAAIREAFPIHGLVLATFIWPEKVQAYLAGEARNDLDEPVPLDLSGFPSVCGCVERYGIIQEFRGWHGNNEVDRCDHDDFLAWEQANEDPLPAGAKFVAGRRCDDSSEHESLLQSSAITTPYSYESGYRQDFSLATAGDYTLYARAGRRAFPGGNSRIEIKNLDTENTQQLFPDDSGAQGLHHLFLENYPAGNYRLTIFTTSSSGNHQIVELYIAPGNNPEGN
jgi:hypothetical protein